MTELEGSTIKSVERTVRVMEALRDRPGTFTDIHRRLPYPRSSLHGILKSLARLGWVTYGADREYSLRVTLTRVAEDRAPDSQTDSAAVDDLDELHPNSHRHERERCGTPRV
jgi:DNA-binding IclR family transcriptional regulator